MVLSHGDLSIELVYRVAFNGVNPSTMVPTYPSTISRSYGAGGASRGTVFDHEAQTRREVTEGKLFFYHIRKYDGVKRPSPSGRAQEK